MPEFISNEELQKMNFKSLAELQAFLDKKRGEFNAGKQPDFEGISPNQMAGLLYHTFEPSSPLKINRVDDAILDQMPFFRTLETLLQIVHREKSVKLTPKGNLPLKICDEVVSHHFWKEELSELYKQRKEEDFQVLHTAKIITQIGNLTRKANGKLTVTKNTAKLLDANDRNGLFRLAFEPFMQKFNWGYHDLYENPHIGQLGWAFTIFLLHKYGDSEQTVRFYAEKYLNAFPMLNQAPTTRYGLMVDGNLTAYNTRTFYRYLNWWGLIERTSTAYLYSSELDDKVKNSEVFTALFAFDLFPFG